MGILCDYNIGNELDFGYGFYLTPIQEHAEDYIINILKHENDMNIGIPLKENKDDKIPLVIEFSFIPMEWYKNGKYNFKFLNSYDDEFAEFVFYITIDNGDGTRQHGYDIIFDVMSDSKPTVLIQRSIALVNLSYGKLDETQSNNLAKVAIKNIDFENSALAHKGINWFAKKIIDTIDFDALACRL